MLNRAHFKNCKRCLIVAATLLLATASTQRTQAQPIPGTQLDIEQLKTQLATLQTQIASPTAG